MTPQNALKQFPPTSPELNDELDDDRDLLEEEGKLTPTEKRILGASVGTLLLPLIVGLALAPFGSVHFMLGTKPMEFPVDPIIYFAFYFVALQMGLILPITFFAYPQIRNFPIRLVRVGVIFMLVGAPLLSYAYYRAGKLAHLGYPEIFLTVLPAALLSSVIFERTERRGLFALSLALGTYLPLFLINDLMGSYSTYFTYASGLPLFYAVRYTAGIGTMVLCLLFATREVAMESQTR